jgi:hypothetical protein
MNTLLKKPSAFMPVAMSGTVLAFIVTHLARFGNLEVPDENAGAHLFQILMPLQAPIIAFFALTWLPRRRNDAREVLALQCGVAVAVFTLVFLFHG